MEEDAYWKPRAASPHWEDQPPSLDRQRERQGERFNCDTPLPPSRGQNWDRDFAGGLYLFYHHIFMYCIMLI